MHDVAIHVSARARERLENPAAVASVSRIRVAPLAAQAKCPTRHQRIRNDEVALNRRANDNLILIPNQLTGGHAGHRADELELAGCRRLDWIRLRHVSCRASELPTST